MEDILIASEVYQDALEEAESFGLLPTESILKLAEKHALFSTQERVEYEQLEIHPMMRYPPLGEFYNDAMKNKFLEKTLTEIILGSRTLRAEDIYFSAEVRPKELEYARFSELNNKKAYMIRHSIEHHAEQRKADVLTQLCSYNGDNGKRVWSTFEAFKNETDIPKMRVVQVRCLEFLGGFNSTTLRYLARHPMWRSKWVSATKTGSPIFKGYICEWSINQTLLSYWSNFYDSIYSAYDPPENFIVEKDELMDRWLENKSSEIKRKQETSDNDDGIKAHFTKHQVMPVKKR